MFEKVKEWGATTSAVVLALSALHVVAAAIYLYFYCVGFGSNLSMFFSAPDIFSISITKLSNVYLRSLVWPVAFFLLLRSVRIKTNTEWVEAAPTPEAKSQRARNIDFATKVSVAIAYATLIATLARVSWDWWHGREGSAYAVASALGFAALFTVIRRLGHAPIPALIGLLFVSGLIGGALDNGQSDRHETYDTSRSLPLCGDFKILGRASSHYLAIHNTDTKVLLNDTCEAVFVFPRPEVS